MSEPTIALIGLDHKDIAAIRAALELASGIELSRWRIAPDAENADVIIAATSSRLPPRNEGDVKPVLALVGDGEGLEDDVPRLARPVTYAGVVQLLKTIQGRLIDPGKPEPPVQTEDKSASAPDPTPPENNETSSPGDAADSSEAPDTEDFTAVELEPEIATAAINADDFSEIDLTDAGRTDSIEEDAPTVSDAAAETGDDAAEPLEGVDLASTETAVSLLDDIGEAFDDITTPTLDTSNPEAPTTSQPRISIAELVAPAGANRSGAETSAGNAASPALNLDDIIRPARRFYPQMRFLGLLRNLIASGEACRISHPYYPPVDLHPQGEWFSFKGDLELAEGLFRAPGHELSVRPLGHDRLPPPDDDPYARPLWALSYTATLYGSEGRLLDSADAHARLKLRKMPDTRVIPWSGDYQRIATYLQDYAANLSQITTVTQINIRTVIDFTNACREIGLIEVLDTRPPGDQRQEPQPDDNPPRGWMKRIRSTLNRLVVKNAG